jgi:hypothetical protein
MSDGLHDHPQYGTLLADHERRLKALEAGAVTPVPPEPVPPTPPDQWPVQKVSDPLDFNRNGHVIKDVVIDSMPGATMTVEGQGWKWNGSKWVDTGARSNSVYGKGYSGCGLENVTLRGRRWGLLIVDMPDFTIGENVRILDVGYCGGGIFGGKGGIAKAPTILRVGTLQKSGLPTIGDPGNSYFIKWERASASGISGASDDDPEAWTIDGGLGEDCPNWQGINAHSGKDLTVQNFTARRVPRPYFFTNVRGLKVINNWAEDASPGGSYGSGDKSGISYGGITGGLIDGNKIGASFSTKINNMSGKYGVGPSAGLTVGTNPTISGK